MKDRMSRNVVELDRAAIAKVDTATVSSRAAA
jgi:hypothetical protein